MATSESKVILDKLIDAIRSAKSLDELKRHVGPSQEQREAEKRRIARMDALSPACKWDEMAPDWQAIQARENYRLIEREQGAYESFYC